MGDLLIRDIPDDLKQELTDSARRTGRSMSEEAKTMLRKGMMAKKIETSANQGPRLVKDICGMFADVADEEREEFSKIMDEIEVERKKDFGHPFSFDE